MLRQIFLKILTSTFTHKLYTCIKIFKIQAIKCHIVTLYTLYTHVKAHPAVVCPAILVRQSEPELVHVI